MCSVPYPILAVRATHPHDPHTRSELPAPCAAPLPKPAWGMVSAGDLTAKHFPDGFSGLLTSKDGFTVL